MKNSIARLAVAAAVVIVAALGVHYLMVPSITFAEVVEPILNARTMIFDVIIGGEETGTTMHEVIVGQKVRRTISSVPGMTMIVDLENSKMLVLTEEDKSAAYVDIAGPVGDRHQNYVAAMRKIITALKDNSENLGEQEIDGQKAILFEAKGPNEQIKIWADPKTALPIRVELNLGQIFWIMKNFQINPQIDEALVSMSVPDGYTAGKEELDMKDATEKDFIECLRVLAKIIGDGTFPDEIGTEQAMKQVTVLGAKLTAMNMSEEEATQMGMSFGKGMMFHQILETGNVEWSYTGQGVKLGDASKAIFWYKPQGSETYRVIYGDLSVKDVSPENLPK